MELSRKIYSQIRKRLSSSQQASLTKLVYLFSGKPFVKPDDGLVKQKFPGSEKGGLILSADFEMAWAFRFVKGLSSPREFAIEKARQERANIPTLVDLFETFRIPVTWATVGHLFLESCDAETHKWMKRIPYFENRWWQYSEGDWFDDDPCSNYTDAPEWYAPDLIKKILASDLNHEFATHTFSHIDFSNKNCPKDVADDEIKASIEAMSKFNLPSPISICFPSGSWGNVPILKKYGIKIYRRKINTVQLTYPYCDDFGLLVTLSSDAFDRSYPSWSAGDYQARYKKVIDKAIRTGTIAHFVFHPSMDPWMIKEVMPTVLEYASQKRHKGQLWVGTMGEIAKHIEGQAKVSNYEV